MRANPHLLELSTLQWINVLNRKYGVNHTLLTVPDAEWHKFKELGFDAIWLMGIWRTGPKAEETARTYEPLLKQARSLHPNDFDINDIVGSPYAIYDYSLNPALGEPDDIAKLHEKLNSLGIKLILDYVSNHLAMDHPLIYECPDCFIQADDEVVQSHGGWFFKPEGSNMWIAHGKDPNFPSWTDSVQLNYFEAKARAYMLEQLLKIASVCDGVRCDMAMLSLNSVHDDTWGWLLRKRGYQRPHQEFWSEAIAAVRAQHPNFCFLAEVYWGLEWTIQEIGFDYTYDKTLYDRLRYMSASDVNGHLNAELMYQKRSLRFIENHDEAPAIAAFGKDKSIAAAVAASTLRGLRLFYYGQIKGIAQQCPIQYVRYDFEPNPDIEKEYIKILKIIEHPAFHGGEWTNISVRPVSHEDGSHVNFLCWSWKQICTYKFVIINYSNSVARCRVPMKVDSKSGTYVFKDELKGLHFERDAAEVKQNGLFVELQPYEFYILDLQF